MTIAALLLPWFVAHGPAMPPIHVAAAAVLSGAGAALLILVVTHGFGIARLRAATCCIVAVLMLFLYGVGPIFGIPQIDGTKRVIRLLDNSYSARPLAEHLGGFAPPDTTVAVFRVRRDTEYGLAFYRNREMVNYEESGVPDEQHLLVVRVQGSHGRDLHTIDDLQEYLEDRHYEMLFTWPEQGLEVFLVGAR